MSQTVRVWGPEIGETELYVDLELDRVRGGNRIIWTNGEDTLPMDVEKFERLSDEDLLIDHDDFDLDSELWDLIDHIESLDQNGELQTAAKYLFQHSA